MGEERAGGDACPFALAPQFLLVWGCAGGDVLKARLEIGGGARRLALIVHGVSLLFTEEVWISGSLCPVMKNWVAPRG